MAPTTISLPSPRQPGPPASDGKRALVYFVCGNPGLIEFYDVFLRSLRALLDASGADDDDVRGTVYDIYGRNLFGFEDGERMSVPWDLEGQTDGIYRDVAARRVEYGDGGQAWPYDFVILMGHSVGAYICVEIMSRHMQDPQPAPHLHLRHGFLLFPTLTHIARSPQGRIAASLLSLPTARAYAHVYAACLLAVIPLFAIRLILVHLMGFAAQAAGITARWLKSEGGVRQALHLAMSEFESICEETWDRDLWEKMADDDEDGKDEDDGESCLPKFFMFFGKHDHWVSSPLRDAFIKRRKDGRSSIEVDEGSIPHEFCTQENTSWLIAKKVQKWIEQIDETRGRKTPV